MSSSHFRIYSEHDVMVFLFLDEFLKKDSELEEIFEDFKQLLEQFDSMRVVIDLSNVKMVSSSMLGRMVSLNKYITENGGRIAVCGANETIKETFRITRLDEIVEFKDTRIEATLVVCDPEHISRVMPVLTEDDLKQFVTDLQKKFKDKLMEDKKKEKKN